MSVFGSTYGCEQVFILMKNVKSRTRSRILLMNTWRDACESQQRELNLILKITQAKTVSDISLMIVFLDRIIE
jgi:hypothetical protein